MYLNQTSADKRKVSEKSNYFILNWNNASLESECNTTDKCKTVQYTVQMHNITIYTIWPLINIKTPNLENTENTKQVIKKD